MSDDLVKRLRDLYDDSFVETIHGPAADRIEELEAKLLSATMDGYDMAKHEYRDRIEELEAKLEKLERWQAAAFIAHGNLDLDIEANPEALAELKGQNDG